MKWINKIIKAVKNIFTSTPSDRPYEPVPIDDSRYDYEHPFPDISHWKKIDFERFTGNHLIFKATEGESFVDDKMEAHINGCRINSIKWGVYHFYRVNKSPIKQAMHFIDTVGIDNLRSCHHLPVVDYETANGQDRYALRKALPELKEFIMYVRSRTDRDCRIYTSDSLMRFLNFDNEFKLICGDPWVARYSEKPPQNCAPWDQLWAWQYSDSYYIEGIGKCDANRFYQ